MPPENVQSLEEAIKAVHKCNAVHVRSEAVHEVFEGEGAWPGAVEVFYLVGHPTAQFAYAWQYEDDDKKTKTVTVLEIPPVDSAETAVKAAIAAKAKEQ